MSHEEYKEKLKELEDQYNNNIREATKQFVAANNPHKVEDIVEDHLGKIRIETIGFTYGFGRPCAVYTGIELLKNGSDNKRGTKRRVCQNNLVK